MSLNAPFLAAAKARATPSESSEVPLHVTHPLTDRLARLEQQWKSAAAARQSAALGGKTA